MTQAIPLPPSTPLPDAFRLPAIPFTEPVARPPSFAPIPLPPAEPKQEVPKPNPPPPKKKEEAPAPRPPVKPPEIALPPVPQQQSTLDTVEIPIAGIEVPVPPQEIMVTAAATAGVSSVTAVAGTLVATNLAKRLTSVFKPVIKLAVKKLANLRGKPPAPTWARQRLIDKRKAIRTP